MHHCNKRNSCTDVMRLFSRGCGLPCAFLLLQALSSRVHQACSCLTVHHLASTNRQHPLIRFFLHVESSQAQAHIPTDITFAGEAMWRRRLHHNSLNSSGSGLQFEVGYNNLKCQQMKCNVVAMLPRQPYVFTQPLILSFVSSHDRIKRLARTRHMTNCCYTIEQANVMKQREILFAC